MKKYLIEKTIIYGGKKRINYHSKSGISDNFVREKARAFSSYEDCLEKLYEIEYYDYPYIKRGFEFKYKIIEV